MHEKTIFRDLAGIADFEIRFSNYERLMKDERADLLHDGERLSVNLFGIRQNDTSFWHGVEAGFAGDFDEWEAMFAFLRRDTIEPDEEAFWNAAGLDLLDEQGAQLECVGYFGRQLVCAVRGLLPAATLRFRSTCQRTDEQIEAEAEAWGRMLMSGR